MRKIILNLCCTLDTFIQGPNGEIDWCLADQDYGMTEFLNRIDTIFFGRHSYLQLQKMAPDAFADKTQIVFSSRMRSSDYDAEIISDDIETNIKKILAKEGKDIWLFGGASLISSLLNYNLVDEMMIAVHPLILGGGKPLFEDIELRKELTLLDSITYSSGLVQLIYKVKKG